MKPGISIAFALTAVFVMLVGCSTPPVAARYDTVPELPHRDSERARALNRVALMHLGKNELAQAEAALKDALAADVTFGPAHNNLGKVYYHQSKYYLAAWEFQYAIKLMPNHPEPRNNLGMVMEAVGKMDEAVEVYAESVNLEPDNAQLLGNLARARVRRGDRDSYTQELLADLIMRDTRGEWVEWARLKLTLMKAMEPR